MHTFIHTYIHNVHIYTYIHNACIHTYTHTYIHIYIVRAHIQQQVDKFVRCMCNFSVRFLHSLGIYRSKVFQNVWLQNSGMDQVAQGRPINIWHHLTKLTHSTGTRDLCITIYIHTKYCDKIYLLVRNKFIIYKFYIIYARNSFRFCVFRLYMCMWRFELVITKQKTRCESTVRTMKPVITFRYKGNYNL